MTPEASLTNTQRPSGDTITPNGDPGTVVIAGCTPARVGVDATAALHPGAVSDPPEMTGENELVVVVSTADELPEVVVVRFAGLVACPVLAQPTRAVSAMTNPTTEEPNARRVLSPRHTEQPSTHGSGSPNITHA